MNSTEIDNANGVFFTESAESKTIKFSFLLVGQILSIPCYMFIIYYFIIHRIVHKTMYNHVVFVSLVMNFPIILISFSLHLTYIRLNTIVPSTAGICLLWQYIDYGFWFGDLVLKFWLAVERHMLIFHSNLVNNKVKRMLFHYIPLLCFTLYCPLVYLYLIFFYPTTHQYDFSILLCGGPYYYNGIPGWLIWYESLAHYVIPVLLMILLAIALPFRVYLQKNRLRVGHGWRQYRKMTTQLISISFVYVFTLPYIMITVIRWSGYPDFGTSVQGPYFYYCTFFPNLLFPMAIIVSIPNLRKKMFHWIHRRQGRRSAIVIPYTTRQR